MGKSALACRLAEYRQNGVGGLEPQLGDSNAMLGLVIILVNERSGLDTREVAKGCLEGFGPQPVMKRTLRPDLHIDLGLCHPEPWFV